MNSYYAKLNEILDEMARVVQQREQATEEEKAALQALYELLKAEFNEITRARHVDYLFNEPMQSLDDSFLAGLGRGHHHNDHSNDPS